MTKLILSCVLMAAQVFAVAVAAPGKTYKDPLTGRDCVTNTGIKRSGDKYIEIHFKNTCDSTFSVKIRPGDGSVTQGTGISPYGTSYITCKAEDRCEQGNFSFD